MVAGRLWPAMSVFCARVFPMRGISGIWIARLLWLRGLPALDGVTFQAELGTQGARARRLEMLAGGIATLMGADAALAARAALLAKADLVTGMVGEFPELQGVMGGYYALHDGEDPAVCEAVRDHYLPKGAADIVPRAPVAIAVALADKLDQLAGFFLDRAEADGRAVILMRCGERRWGCCASFARMGCG